MLEIDNIINSFLALKIIVKGNNLKVGIRMMG